MVDLIKTVSKSSRKSMYPGLQEQKERSEIDGLWCMYRTVMRKYKAQDGTSDEDRNISGMRIKARRGLAIIWGM